MHAVYLAAVPLTGQLHTSCRPILLTSTTWSASSTPSLAHSPSASTADPQTCAWHTPQRPYLPRHLGRAGPACTFVPESSSFPGGGGAVPLRYRSVGQLSPCRSHTDRAQEMTNGPRGQVTHSEALGHTSNLLPTLHEPLWVHTIRQRQSLVIALHLREEICARRRQSRP